MHDGDKSDRVVCECGDNGGPVDSMLSRTGSKEAEDRTFDVSESVRGSVLYRRSALYWRATTAGGEVEERGGADDDVSGVG